MASTFEMLPSSPLITRDGKYSSNSGRPGAMSFRMVTLPFHSMNWDFKPRTHSPVSYARPQPLTGNQAVFPL